MRFKRRSKNHVHLENIALTDIIMNLFLCFVISFGLSSSLASKHRESPLKVNLPTLEKGSTTKSSSAAHEITLLKNGGIVWDNVGINAEQLRLKLVQEKDRSELLSLRSDRETSVQTLVSVLGIIRETGATNVSLQTELISPKNQ